MRATIEMKLIFRNAWAATLAVLPMSILNPIRIAYGLTDRHSFKHKILHQVLRLLRYRNPDSTLQYIQPVDCPDLRLRNIPSIIVRRVFWLGETGYEGEEILWWKKFCATAKGTLEIGGNIGFYTMQGARAAPSTPYIVVEPHPVSARILRENLELNRITNVKVVEAALVGRKLTEAVDLIVPAMDQDDTPSGAFIRETAEGINRRSRQVVQVPVVEAQELISGIDLIKIDVEGQEWEILSQVEDYVAEIHPTIFIEILRKSNKLRILLAEWCNQFPYKIYAITPDDLHQISADSLSSIDIEKLYGARDIILTTETIR